LYLLADLAQFLPGAVAFTDIDACLHRKVLIPGGIHDAVLLLETKAKVAFDNGACTIPKGQREALAAFVRKGIEVWVLFQPRDSEVIDKRVLGPRGQLGAADLVTMDQLARMVKTWWDEAGRSA
jgi:hypothetical protein